LRGTLLEWATRIFLNQLLDSLFGAVSTGLWRRHWPFSLQSFSCRNLHLFPDLLKLIKVGFQVEFVLEHPDVEHVELAAKLVSLLQILTVDKLLDLRPKAV